MGHPVILWSRVPKNPVRLPPFFLLCEPLLAHELDERGAELRGRRRHLHAGGGQRGDLRVGRALKL